jgi:hypothetical protein
MRRANFGLAGARSNMDVARYASKLFDAIARDTARVRDGQVDGGRGIHLVELTEQSGHRIQGMGQTVTQELTQLYNEREQSLFHLNGSMCLHDSVRGFDVGSETYSDFEPKQVLDTLSSILVKLTISSKLPIGN